MTIKYSNKRKPLYGIGINDADYNITKTINGKATKCPYYIVWKGMFMRCYCKKFHNDHPTYSECSVSEEWHSFMTFRSWMETQNWKMKHLDKDIIYPGNKIYSSDTCVFVTRAVNQIITTTNIARKGLPRGVCYHKRDKHYTVQMKHNGKNKHIGVFDTTEEASQAYRNAKRIYILKTACCEKDIRVKQGLYRHSELLR